MAKLKDWISGERPDRPPRGALIVIAVGLIATVAAAALANTNLSGDAAHLEWVQTEDLPDSEPVGIPGGKGEQMQLVDANLRATGMNVSGYTLYRTAASLRIDAQAPVGSARILCAASASGSDTEIAQTPELRASYPRSSDDLVDQPAYEVSLVEFASHGTGLAVVEIEDLPDKYATEEGIKLEWPTYTTGRERWRYFLPPGQPSKDLVLPFTAIWRATQIPEFEISCTLTTSAGEASISTGGAIEGRPAAIDEG
jgi:hypothetical protein